MLVNCTNLWLELLDILFHSSLNISSPHSENLSLAVGLDCAVTSPFLCTCTLLPSPTLYQLALLSVLFPVIVFDCSFWN